MKRTSLLLAAIFMAVLPSLVACDSAGDNSGPRTHHNEVDTTTDTVDDSTQPEIVETSPEVDPVIDESICDGVAEVVGWWFRPGVPDPAVVITTEPTLTTCLVTVFIDDPKIGTEGEDTIKAIDVPLVKAGEEGWYTSITPEPDGLHFQMFSHGTLHMEAVYVK